MKRVTFEVDKIMTGLMDMFANGDVTSPWVNTSRSLWHSFTFTEPPTTMKFVVYKCLTYHVPFIQVCLQ